MAKSESPKRETFLIHMTNDCLSLVLGIYEGKWLLNWGEGCRYEKISAKINKLLKERKGEMGERNGWRNQKGKSDDT